jgi:hypothetical protein
MSIAATRNQALRPRAVDNRDSLKYDVWRKRTQELGNFICQICQFRPKRLVVHHLFSMNSFPSIMYNSLNSVTLDAFIHTIFHQIYGYRQAVTIDCFIHFLETLLTNPILLAQVYSGTQPRTNNQDKNLNQNDKISSQTSVQSEGSVTSCNEGGSETRFANSVTSINSIELTKQIRQLHERMVERRSELYSLLTPAELEASTEVQKRLNKLILEKGFPLSKIQ